MAPGITVRHPRFDFSDLPARWLAGSRVATGFGNAGHVFIPLGEQFFIDSVKEFRGLVDDEAQRRDINAFIGQEVVHARAHGAMWDRLRAQGVPVDSYARLIETVRRAEPLIPAKFRLSVTAALEHYTAAFGLAFITEDLGTAVPDEMARLLSWHGLEELEHRAVAYDVLQLVDDGYLLRIAGFAFATGLLLIVPATGTAMFTLADHGPALRDHVESDQGAAADGRGLARMTRRFARRMGGHVVDYLRPGFHPADLDVPADLADAIVM